MLLHELLGHRLRKPVVLADEPELFGTRVFPAFLNFPALLCKVLGQALGVGGNVDRIVVLFVVGTMTFPFLALVTGLRAPCLSDASGTAASSRPFSGNLDLISHQPDPEYNYDKTPKLASEIEVLRNGHEPQGIGEAADAL